MVKFRTRRMKKNDGVVVDIEKVIIEVIKDGKVVAIIYPTNDGIKIGSTEMKQFEANNGEEMVPSIPTIYMKF